MKFPFAQKLIALSLVVFLSGTCCLLCCEVMKAAPAEQAESCPMGGKDHHCCPKKDETGGQQLGSAAGEQPDKCCPFISKRFDLARKNEPEQKGKVSSPVKIFSPAFLRVAQTSSISLPYASVIHNRGST